MWARMPIQALVADISLVQDFPEPVEDHLNSTFRIVDQRNRFYSDYG